MNVDPFLERKMRKVVDIYVTDFYGNSCRDKLNEKLFYKRKFVEVWYH